ncbi:hypothetical protein CDAR_545051 [Caerostris darwini]|uniref:Uncharacterized protein n=1 Tax=Caerostris darwini TaxID=1538125 RepID=A0AAV4PVK4_9ARAC|nr:hypothetical protein CDAR_545051 [Caerostris darwini]
MYGEFGDRPRSAKSSLSLNFVQVTKSVMEELATKTDKLHSGRWMDFGIVDLTYSAQKSANDVTTVNSEEYFLMKCNKSEIHYT